MVNCQNLAENKIVKPKDWKKIKDVFIEALEIPLDKREVFLNEKFNGDKGLRVEVEKLLAVHDLEDDSDDLEKNAFDYFQNENDSQIPKQIGKYKIIREIGKGGMGRVFEAIWETENFTQKVALKVIKRGMDTDAILSRFRHEQKILSSLEHPNIARFLDGGMTEDNLPFYAMEFVEGEFIDDYCKVNNLSINERLKLFRKVCVAVQYAHQNLVIHRDLKPKNILVTKDGTPKLLDFGIGKILTPESSEKTGTATQFGMMTPAYASPEQVKGERISTTSDVYSLGVILFELLTGEKPYKTETDSQIELQKAILETEPTKPSVVSSERSAVNSKNTKHPQNFEILKGDLDNVILKTLRKNPNNRYSSVQEFSEDIRRHLEGLPVSARPLTLKYRATKFYQRNKISVLAGILVFLSLIGGIAVSLWQTRKANIAQAKAEKRFAEVRELANNVVFKYHDAMTGIKGTTGVREMLIKDATKYLDNLAKDSEGDFELQKELGIAYIKLGDVQGKMYQANVGDSESASKNYRKAIGLLEEVTKNLPNDIEAKDKLIEVYDNLAFLMIRVGKTSETNKLVEKALALHESLQKLEPNNEKRKLQFIDLIVRHGDVAKTHKERIQRHEKALKLVEKFSEQDLNDFEKVKVYTRVYQRLGSDYSYLGLEAETKNDPKMAKEIFAKTLPFYEKSLEGAKKIYELEPAKPESKRFLMIAYGNYAQGLAWNEKFDESLEVSKKYLELVNEYHDRDSKNKEAKHYVTVSNSTMAEIYFRKKDYKSAIEWLLKALKIDKEMFAADQNNLEALSRITNQHETLAKYYDSVGNLEKSRFHAQKGKEFRKLLKSRTGY